MIMEMLTPIKQSTSEPFYKRGWFKFFVILIPTWMIPFTYIVSHIGLIDFIGEYAYMSVLILLYMFSLVIGIATPENSRS